MAVFEDVNNHVGYLGKELEKHERWIIVTTIQTPTPALKALAKIPGWKVLVVGDAKTPLAWKYVALYFTMILCSTLKAFVIKSFIFSSIPGVIFLDLQKQEKLGYHIVSVLPYDSYTRKLIAYLYAIQVFFHCMTYLSLF